MMQQRMKDFDENYSRIRHEMAEAALRAGRDPAEVRLLAAVKMVLPEVINYAVQQGLDLIGDNRIQEMVEKRPLLVNEPEHHFIGHLQTNKVRNLIGKIDMIESVHSLKLAREIAKQSAAADVTTDVLLEVNIGREESKSGFFTEELDEAVAQIAEMDGIKVRGLMTIPPICQTNCEICAYFEKMQKVFIDFSDKRIDNISMEYLSMGMSGDFNEAIGFGANIIRIGTALFGARNYTK
jgi:pyridoxal phosphate enzyme (YggS family)